MRYKIVLILVIIAILAGSMAFYNPPDEKKESKVLNVSATAKEFDSENAMTFSTEICNLGVRYGGNDAELKAADLMEKKLEENGIEAHKEKVDLGGGEHTYNVIGVINGTNPNKYIIIASHIDSPGFCEGATDDAAALGIQVEIARILASKGIKPEKTILIIGFGGEELWFKGSEDFVKKHPEIIRNCEAVIDLNCVGAGENIFLVQYSYQPKPVKGDPKLINLTNECAQELGHPVIIGETTYPSDTYPFYYNNIKRVPVCQVMSQPFKVPPWSSENNADKLDQEDMKKIGETITLVLLKLAR
ncbi:MAG TPA: M20/M25/M40 family metallo-hydrolase [Methanothermobacter sp.]|nr:predicted aminopeptidase [Methanothermobacter sp. MT-2]HHW05667.1 M20/M25/M40 family metallo-hydrolase [Methanothermobacter sp.]HOK73387.1 M20/M25/M40 family metallo-hydrolase [Methanothermobacter sp.]HOL69471.1 M20/M25/M40 family metallo-hydrolase [Methanothermobacter sp.]HPQ05070.1 M20/M25/M40 family metallo-hydrolase [Methanothermobacter sp.]